MRVPRWPGETDWMGIRKAGLGGSAGSNTREVRDTLADTGWSLSCSFMLSGSSTGSRSLQRNVMKAGPCQGETTNSLQCTVQYSTVQYSIVYNTVYSTVHSTVYSTVYSSVYGTV